jgi:aspartate aminotransferase
VKGTFKMDFGKRISRRLAIIQPSATVELNEKAAALVKTGKKVIALAAGEPDFDPPPYVVRETKKAVASGFTHYTSSMGIIELRETIAEKLREDNGLTYDPAKQILVTPGAKQGIAYACLAYLDEGDEVLSPEPAWVSYPELVALAGGKYVAVPTRPEENFRITREALERAVTPRSRMIFINSPCNPTGRVLTRQELEDIAAVAQAHDLIVLSDEIYEKLVFDGHQHISIATLPGMQERTLLLNGFSKMYAMTGFRLGYVAGPAEAIRELNKLQQHTATCPTAFAQKGAAGSYTKSAATVKKMVKQFARRRTMMVDLLSKIEGMKVVAPEGSFYMWLDCRAIDMDSKRLSYRLLDEALVALTPGVAFGKCGEGFLRLSFAMDEATLTEAAARLARVLGSREQTSVPVQTTAHP